ncbi:MAG TPA: glycosyltransferase family 2 protein [Propionibacteriaceae bacterium]|nr:glycosyltransferase family 2 protein [Propionibacteriaceae bacterium]
MTLRNRRSREPAGTSHGQPIVSVIVPVYNVEPYLRECLDSVLAQSIGLDRLELIAVDDGSTDGSAELLDGYAGRHRCVRVFHEPNSGGPGRPRNVGLNHASGKYVFFVDADDYLGQEALERLVDMAERNGSDIVLGKMVGIAGRRLPTKPFRRTLRRADLRDVYHSLNVLKLFRRSLIERVGTRFDELASGGEDGLFTAELYLSANVISVVADYTCYYCRHRPDSQTKRVRTEDPADRLMRMAQRAQLLAQHRPPGRKRDHLMARHIRDLLRPFNRGWLGMAPEDRRRVFDVGSGLLDRWNNARIQATLSPFNALRAYCLQHGLLTAMEDIVGFPAQLAFRQPIVDGSRVFARFPHFRDTHGIPDSCFEITRMISLHGRLDAAELTGGRLVLSGKARLSHIGGDTTVVLKRWPRGEERRYPTTARTTPRTHGAHTGSLKGAFEAEIDLVTPRDRAPLSAGPWEIRLAVGPPTLQRESPVKLTKRESAALPIVFDLPRRDTETRLYRSTDGTVRLRMAGDASARSGLELALAAAARLGRHARRRVRHGVKKGRRSLKARCRAVHHHQQ